MDHVKPDIRRLAAERILLLDGAMGTMIQQEGLEEADFRGEMFRDHPSALKGDNDLLCLTRPDVIARIHRSTWTPARTSSRPTPSTPTLSRRRTTGWRTRPMTSTWRAHVWRASPTSIPPRRRTSRATLPAQWGQPTAAPRFRPTSTTPARNVTFDELKEAYAEQARGLLDGGVDLLLVETIFDTLNAKAALFAIDELLEQRGESVPVMISGTITDASGRTLSGQTTEAFWNSVMHARPFSVGLNCALGAKEMRPYLETLSAIADTPVSCHPNAGLPNEFGEYDQSPQEIAAYLGEFAQSGFVNIVGGCCGTTPEHIRAIAQAVEHLQPRAVPEIEPVSRFSGLEPLAITPFTNFVNVGERTNVTGSARFRRLIMEGDFEAGVRIAAQQVENGAQMIDVNFDDGMLDGEAAMVRFLNLIAAEPDIARVPVMIDSSKWSVLEAGLKCVQGKSVVNSISLKEGEEEFKRRARLIRRYGAAAVVMAFDEQGQADTLERRVAICTRAYRILTEEAGFPPEDIIFDPNILTVGTGIEEHAPYAIDFIEATRRIKATLPGVKVSGGVSNVSFAFRGNNTVREAMHAAFLYHAIQAGMDMGIVNAGALMVYEDIPPELLERVEDVLFNRRPDATERLVAYAETVKGTAKKKTEDLSWRAAPVHDRLVHALVRGIADFVEEDAEEARQQVDDPVQVIEGPPADGMNHVGDLRRGQDVLAPGGEERLRHEAGAAAYLTPYIEAARRVNGGGSNAAGKIAMATVKGDVHDIGKNIVGVVLGCNNYEIIDLGVMTPAEKILQTAIDENAGHDRPERADHAFAGRDGARRQRDGVLGMDKPLLIGGATTSRMHAAVRIDPAYPGPVVHVNDARAAGVVESARSTRRRATSTFRMSRLNTRRLRELHQSGQIGRLRSIWPRLHRRRFAPDWDEAAIVRPAFLGVGIHDDINLGTSSREDRLDAVLPRLGGEGRISPDPQRPGEGRAGACSTRTHRPCWRRWIRTGSCRRELSSASIRPMPAATTCCSTRTSRAARSRPRSTCCASRRTAACRGPATAWPTSRRRLKAASPTMRASSP